MKLFRKGFIHPSIDFLSKAAWLVFIPPVCVAALFGDFQKNLAA